MKSITDVEKNPTQFGRNMLGDLKRSHDQQVIMTGHSLNRPNAPPLRYESPPECIVLRPGLQERLVRCGVCDPLPPKYSLSEHMCLHVVVLVTKNHPNGCRCGQLVQRLDASLGSCHVPVHGLGEITRQVFAKHRNTHRFLFL
jgi:hypothetical protein